MILRTSRGKFGLLKKETKLSDSMSLINNLDEDNKKKAELLVLNLIDYLFQAISVAINKAHMFSKWLLLGSLISIFSVISSIENYSSFYNAYSIKAFLGFLI